MWSHASCPCTSLQYQHAIAVALSAGQYIDVAPGEYVHLIVGDDTTTSVIERMDHMLLQKMPQETSDDVAFTRRMKAGKQVGSDMMTERVIRESNKKSNCLKNPNSST